MGLRSWLGVGDRRRTGLPETTYPAADTPGGRTSGTGGGPSGAWRDLPPLQRTTDDLGLLSDPGGFRASLDTWQDVSLSRPLGHLVSPEAPTGLLYGIASPAEAPAPGHEAGQAPLFDPASRASGLASRTTDSARTDVAVQRTPDTAALTFVASAGTEVTGLPLTAQPAPASAAEAPPAVRDMPLVPPAPVQRTAEPPRLPRTPHHHLSVGEPLAHLPFTAQREPAGRSVPAPVRPGDTELPLPLDPFNTGATPSVQEKSVAPTNPLLGDDPLVPAEAQAPQAGVPALEFGPQQSSPPETADPVRPLTVVGVQRLPSAADKAPTTAEESERTAGLTGERPLPLFTEAARAEAPAPGPTVVVARWAARAEAPGPSGMSGPSPGSPTPGTPATSRNVPVPVVVPTVQRAPVPPAGPGQQRHGASPVNSPRTDAGSASVAAGVAQRAVDGSVVFGPRSLRPAATNPVPVQRATDPAPLPEPEPAPVPDPPPAPAPDPEPPAPAPPSSSHSTAPAAPQDAGSAHSVDDELVRALFPRLSRLLKAELRLDRERAGFLITTRH